MPNRLIYETSPYLLQHANNPVDWNPWDEEALSIAKRLDKPILVSIGYSACHWCHVMERESFEDEAIAKEMNQLFVCIKVDREERPDLDAIYMQAVVAIAGRGGWPLTVFLTPDGRPFYGGTYYPPEDRHGLPGFKTLLSVVSQAYINNHEKVLHNAQILTEHIQPPIAIHDSVDPIGNAIADKAFHGIEQTYDSQYAGFGPAPKFPQAMALSFLLRLYKRTGNPDALQIVDHSLSAMADGGIYDHLGGGFHRYSTDRIWLVPHFEKMLYDNALLSQVYLEAYQVTKNAKYRRIVEETLNYLLRENLDHRGGLYSSQDADSEGAEGKFYVWDEKEIDSLLTRPDAIIAKSYFGITPEGNFEGVNILNTIRPASPQPAQQNHKHPNTRTINKIRRIMFTERAQRPAPTIDDKILTSWNGLGLRVLSDASMVFNSARYRNAAENAAAFLLENLHDQGRLLRTWREGKAHLKGYLEDYASLILGLLSVHETTFNHKWLFAAQSLTDEMLLYFWDKESGSFFDVGWDHDDLLVRPQERADNAIPSGCSAAAESLIRMSRLTGNVDYLTKAESLLRSVALLAANYPLGFGNWLKVFELYCAAPVELAIVGNSNDPMTRLLIQASKQAYDPNRIFIGLNPQEETAFYSPILEGRGMLDQIPTAYICRNYMCDLPVTDPFTLLNQLSN